jgi:hypothetical protein
MSVTDNIRNEVVTIHRSQGVLKMLSHLHVDFPHTGRRGCDQPFKAVLQEYLQIPYKYFLLVLPVEFSVGNFVLQRTTEEKVTVIKFMGMCWQNTTADTRISVPDGIGQSLNIHTCNVGSS